MMEFIGTAQSLPSSFSVEAKQQGFYNMKTEKFEDITNIDRQIVVKSSKTFFIDNDEFRIIDGPKTTVDNVISYILVGSEKVDHILIGVHFFFDEYQNLTQISYFGIEDDDTGYAVILSKLKLIRKL
jgi:hypothetical protein